MKTFIYGIISAIAVVSYAHAQTVLFQDDFNGNSIDTFAWNVSLPNIGGTSTADESGGNLTITHRATIYTIQGFNTPYSISGNFTLASPSSANEEEQFDVYFQSNFSIYSPLSSFAVPTGVLVDFAATGNPNNLNIQQFDSNNQAASMLLAGTNYTLNDGTTYHFNIDVNGPTVSVYVDNAFALSATSSIATGNQVGFEDGIFPGDSASVNSFQVSSIPEPGMYGMVLGIAGLLGVLKFKKAK